MQDRHRQTDPRPRPDLVPAFPILGVLGLIFVTLKLTHQIAWSWWWVTCPFWVAPTIALVCFVLLLCIRAIELLVARRKKGKRGPIARYGAPL